MSPAKAVLGASEIAPQTFWGKMVLVIRNIPNYVKIKLLALFLMSVVIIALASMLYRNGRIPITLSARAIVILALLGYAATSGISDWHLKMITPTSAEIVSGVE
jgi:hypothetical protein